MIDITDITSDRTGDTTGRATLRSLCPESLVNTLYDAIQHEWSNNALEVIIKELFKKGYKYEKLLYMVENKFGKPAALKVIRIIFNQ